MGTAIIDEAELGQLARLVARLTPAQQRLLVALADGLRGGWLEPSQWEQAWRGSDLSDDAVLGDARTGSLADPARPSTGSTSSTDQARRGASASRAGRRQQDRLQGFGVCSGPSSIATRRRRSSAAADVIPLIAPTSANAHEAGSSGGDEANVREGPRHGQAEEHPSQHWKSHQGQDHKPDAEQGADP
jgi:hypothetical protein